MIRDFGLEDVLFLLHSAGWTLVLAAAATLLGGALGLGVALARVGASSVVRRAAQIYIAIIQGVPVLMVLFLSYYGLARVGFELPPTVAASLALGLYASAYLGEIWRGAIQSVPRGQWEASASLGLSMAEQYRHVILPQSVTIALPPTIGFLVQLVKNTSIVSVVSVVELTRAGQLVNNATFQPFRVFGAVAVIYLAICYPMSRTSRYLERRLGAHRAR
jgi:polar amino acid transport system permease protein